MIRRLLLCLALLTVPAASLTAPAAAATGWAWCSSARDGAQTYGDQLADNNMWNGSAGPQTICANSASDVRVTSDQPTGNTAVETYPDVQRTYSPNEPVSRFRELRSYFTEAMPTSDRHLAAEFASDDWLTTPGGPGNQFEVMVWMDAVHRAPVGRHIGTVTWPSGTFKVWHTGSWFAFIRTANETRGFIQHLAAYQWLIRHRYLPADAIVQQAEIGWEICSTTGNRVFTITRNTLVQRGG